jgi:hypothetical protein
VPEIDSVTTPDVAVEPGAHSSKCHHATVSDKAAKENADARTDMLSLIQAPYLGFGDILSHSHAHCNLSPTLEFLV